MFVSAYDKDLNYDWTTDGYKEFSEDVDLSFYSIKQSKLHPKSPIQKKITLGFNKQELSLPKTKLTKKGQLCLITDSRTNSDRSNKSVILPPGELNINVTKKPYHYTKKWVDNLTDNFSLSASHILKERYEKITDDKKKIQDVVGKQSNYFINTLRTKSGRDRCMTRASYEEYLPPDFDSKNELEATLRSYANSRAKNNTPTDLSRNIGSRQTFFSFFDENNEIFRSETDLNMSQSFDKSKFVPNYSRLSGQPVLSSQQLIDNLNKNNNTDCFDAVSVQQNKKPGLTRSLINYTKDYIYDESDDEKENPESSPAEESLLQHHEEPHLINKSQNQDRIVDQLLDTATVDKTQQENLSYRKFIAEKEQRTIEEFAERKRLLMKRGECTDNKLLSGALVVKIPVPQSQSRSEFDETSIRLDTARQNKRRAQSSKPKRTERLCRMNSNKSVDLKGQNVRIVDDKQMNEDSIQFNKHLTQSMNFVSTPSESRISIFDKETVYSTDQMENYISHEPITISVTEINHMSSSVKIRRYFDREALRIKQMSLRSADSRTRIDSAKSNSTKLFNSNLQRLNDTSTIKLHSETSNRDKKTPNLCNNSMTTLIVDETNSEFTDHSLFPLGVGTPNLSINKQDKLTNAQRNKISGELRKPRRPIHSTDRIRSAPLASSNSKLELLVGGTGGGQRKVKSALNSTKRRNTSVESKTETSRSSSAEKNSSITDLVTSAVSKNGKMIIDFKNQKDSGNLADTDRKSMTSTETTSTLSHDQIQTNISKIVLKEKTDMNQGDLTKSLYKIAESENGSIDANKKFQLDYSIRAAEDELCIRTFSQEAAILNSTLEVKLMNDLSYKKDLELVNLEKEAIINKKLMRMKEIEEVKIEQDKKKAEKINKMNENNKDEIHKEMLDTSQNSQDLIEKQSQDKTDMLEIQNDEAICEESLEIVNESEPTPEPRHQERETKNKEIVSQVSKELLNSLVMKGNEIIPSQTVRTSNASDASIDLRSLNDKNMALSTNINYTGDDSDKKIEEVPKKDKKLDKKSDKPMLKMNIQFSENDVNTKENNLKSSRDQSLTLNTPTTGSTNSGQKPDTIKTNKKVEFSDKVTSKLINSNTNREKISIPKPTNPANSSILKKPDDSANPSIESLNNNTKPLTFIADLIKNTPEEPGIIQDSEIEKIDDNQVVSNEDENEKNKDDYYEITNCTILNPSILIGDESSSEESDPEEVEEVPEVVVVKPKLYRTVIPPKVYLAKYPHLEIPWDSKEPIVDYDEYNRRFEVPEVLCPRVYEINPSKTSIDELLLERRILEEKIIDIKQKKLNRNEKSKLPSEEHRANSHKEKVYNEERLRLQNETLKKQFELESIEQFLMTNIKGKADEIQNLTTELGKNKREYDGRMKSIEEQLYTLDNNMIEIKDMVLNSKVEIRNALILKFQTERMNLKELQQNRKEQKYADYDEKIKNIDGMIESESLPVNEIEKCELQKAQIENELQKWMKINEYQALKEDQELEAREIKEDNHFAVMEAESEAEAYKSVKQQRKEVLEEKKNLVENFDKISAKITSRIEQIKKEKEIIDLEKKSFDENMQKDLELKKAKLVEILKTEHEARMQIKKELDIYKKSLFKKREDNLRMKYSLSMMKHCHSVTKSHEMTYMSPLNRIKDKDPQEKTDDKKKPTGKGKK